MKKAFLILTLFSSLLTLSACQSESNSLHPAPTHYKPDFTPTDGVKIDINPKVDILFVIDDSGSMKGHIANLKANIHSFIDGIGKDNVLDLQIGTLTVWDSRRYGQYDIHANKVVGTGPVPAIGRDNKPMFSPIGFLRPLKAPEGKDSSLKGQAGNFVKKAEGFVDILKETLDVGISHYYEKTDDKRDAQGPEYEEVFTPVLAALREPVLNTWNKGFLRKDAHLVVVFATDANDASDVSAEQMHQFLIELKGRGNFTLIAIVNPTRQSNRNCPRDPSGFPWKIEDLVRRARGEILNICGNYAKQLLQVGKLVQDRTLGEIRIQVPLNDVDKMTVHYGDQPIPVSQTEGWTYDTESKEVVIRGAANWPYQPNAKIVVSYEPVDPTRASSKSVLDELLKNN